VPVQRPPLLRLGGEADYAEYEAEFDRLFRVSPVSDILGRRVEFPPHACRHVCFKGEEADPYGRQPRRLWVEERAERIPWILTALQEPTEVRPSHQVAGREAYLLLVPCLPESGRQWERFGVFAEVAASGPVTFLTAYPLDENTWRKARGGGRRLYPPPVPPKGKKRHP
jgi:hypothetical protein